MSRGLAVDASYGAAGDMFIAALVDLGAPLSSAQLAVDAVYPNLVQFISSEVDRAGTRATYVKVEELSVEPPKRTWSDISERIIDSSLPADVKAISYKIFSALAEAEARVHKVELGDVHFHEVGAADSIADIIGVAALLAELEVSHLILGNLEVGSGIVKTEHGLLSVPAPATAELLMGFSTTASKSGECLTPTAAAIFSALGNQLDISVAGKSSGLGAGTRNPAEYPNILRVSMIENVADHLQNLIECNIDDIDPRLIPVVIEKLMAAGALDAWVEPIMMKKNRPGFQLKALCRPEDEKKLGEIILRETTSIGYRTQSVAKVSLDRFFTSVSVRESKISLKVSTLDGKIVQISPEFEDAYSVAKAQDIPTRIVLDEARAAALEAGLRYGADFSG